MSSTGNRYTKKVKEDARILRIQGYSFAKIQQRFGISKSTASHWFHDIHLAPHLKRKLEENSERGRKKGRDILKKLREKRQQEYNKEARECIKILRKREDILFWKFLVALIFWCEGSKRSISNGLVLINSDPRLVAFFLKALRSGFDIDEKKFHPLLHLHEYHNDATQKRFWSDITKIPISQFTKSYIKPHTKIRKREGYPGCISLRYGDSRLARRVDALYHTFHI